MCPKSCRAGVARGAVLLLFGMAKIPGRVPIIVIAIFAVLFVSVPWISLHGATWTKAVRMAAAAISRCPLVTWARAVRWQHGFGSCDGTSTTTP